MFADTELEAEVEPSLETEQRLAAEEAAGEEAARKHDAELARMAQEALAQAAQAERQRTQQEADLERLRQVGQYLLMFIDAYALLKPGARGACAGG